MNLRLNPKRMIPTPRGRVGLHAPSDFDPNAPRFGARATGDSIAPVCPITRGEVPPAQPGIRVPSIAHATDPDSAVKAINQVIDIINEESTPTIRWLEDYRVTAIVRIFNPEDDSQWVDVERIMKLVMRDQITDDLWVWELEHTNPPAPSDPSVVINQAQFLEGKWSVAAIPPSVTTK